MSVALAHAELSQVFVGSWEKADDVHELSSI
jgi:hypothetical protein